MTSQKKWAITGTVCVGAHVIISAETFEEAQKLAKEGHGDLELGVIDEFEVDDDQLEDEARVSQLEDEARVS